MTYIGKPDSVVRPVVTANGVNVVSARVTMRVGEIPTCSLSLRPEAVSQFDNVDQEVSVVISGSGGGGTIFKGYPTGINCSNMSGSVSAGVDLIHKARDLSETSTIVPGIVPASNADTETYIYNPAELVKGAMDSKNIRFPVDQKEFGSAICEGLYNFISFIGVSASVEFLPSAAGDKQKALAMVSKIGAASAATSGRLGGADPAVASWVSEYCAGMLSRGGSSATIWDVLSMIAGAFDSYLVCLPGGGVTIAPNFSGVRSSGNEIPSEIIQKFDRSSLSKRSPKECRIIHPIASAYMDNKNMGDMMGSATTDLPGCRGTLMMSCPGWIAKMQIGSNERIAKRKAMADKYAKSVAMRYAHEDKTFSIMCPVCPNVFPGTCATFRPASSIKSFQGGKISVFDKTFDGYCYQVEHFLSTGAFYTSFMFKAALDTDTYQKESSHPLFDGATMMRWT